MVPLGIPHSHFLGGPLVWTEQDRDKALAYRREMDKICKGCGVNPTDFDTDPDSWIGDFYVCPGCARLEEERSNVPDDAKGVHYRLLPKEAALARVEAGEGIA